MPKAVQFTRNGGVDVLDVAEVDQPRPGPGQVVVAVVATAINPGEIMLREGKLGETTFPSGQGSDLAGRIHALGAGVTGFQAGDEVIGWSDERSAQAEYVVLPVERLTPKPANVSWEQAGALYVAGGTAAAMTHAVEVGAGKTVVVAGAGGGVGSILVQLLRRSGAWVIGIIGPDNVAWLQSLGVQAVVHGDGLEDRLRAAAPAGIDALFDTYGGGYVELGVELGVAPDRIVTIIDFDTASRVGAQTVFGYQSTDAAVLAELAGLIDAGQLTVPIAATYDLNQVRSAYRRLAQRHTRGKIVLRVAAQ